MAKLEESVMQTVAASKIFAGLERSELDKLITCFSEETHPLDTVLIKQSDTSDKVYLIIDGSIEVTLELIGNESEAAVASLGRGETVGEFALVGNARRSASAVVSSPNAKILAAQASVLTKFFNEESPRSGYIVFRNLSRILVDRLVNLNMFTRTALSQYQVKPKK